MADIFSPATPADYQAWRARLDGWEYANVSAVEHVYPLVRSQQQVDRVLDEIEEAPGIVLNMSCGNAGSGWRSNESAYCSVQHQRATRSRRGRGEVTAT